jgi:hypothetical protein
VPEVLGEVDHGHPAAAELALEQVLVAQSDGELGVDRSGRTGSGTGCMKCGGGGRSLPAMLQLNAY